MHVIFVVEMSDNSEDIFEGPSYLEDFDIFPYNTVDFAHCDPAAQLQWSINLQAEIHEKIQSLKRCSFNQRQKQRKLNELYEIFYVHIRAEWKIRQAIMRAAKKINGLH